MKTPSSTDSAAPSPWPVFWGASIATFLVSLDTTMLFAAFDPLRRAFADASAADLSWVLNAYTVACATMLIPAGGLADTHGRKRVFLIGVALFLAASAACGLAGSIGWLIGARVLQAVGAALLTPASLSIVLAAFPQSRRAVVVSLWGAVGGLAAAVGAITLAIVESESATWSRSELVLLGATGVVAGGAFVAWARKAPAPLIDLALFQHRTLSPLAALRVGSGRVVGREALRRYWRMGLDAQPQLRFELDAVLAGGSRAPRRIQDSRKILCHSANSPTASNIAATASAITTLRIAGP